MIKILSVAGARPNFIKIAPVFHAINDWNRENPEKQFDHKICHTGQHYDYTMSKAILDDLQLPEPDFNLGIGSASHALQTARIMIEFDKVLDDFHPHLVIVVGDVNSTMACSLVAVKKNIKIAHIESGLRSFDRTMPEEINRLVTDAISDFLFVSERSGIKNLKNEGIPDEKVFFVGNVMIDSLIKSLELAKKSDILERLNLSGGEKSKNYILMTFHRPSNVDDHNFLNRLIKSIDQYSKKMEVVFPMHPRTKKKMEENGFKNFENPNLIVTEPLGYLDFLSLMTTSRLIITDSGGLQEETTYLQVPCITVRENTERPVTVEVGTNYLVGTNLEGVDQKVNEILNGQFHKGKVPELWDGKTAERIIEIISDKFHIT